MSFQTLEALAAGTRTVRVNLLPPEYTRVRGARRLRLALVAGVVVVAGACAAAGSVSVGHVAAAQAALDTEQARTASLRAEQAPYAEVPAVVKQLSNARAVQEQVSAADVPFYRYVDLFAANAPADLSYTTLAMVTNDEGTTTTTSQADSLMVPGIGTVTVTGSTRSQGQIAAWMDRISTVPGVADPTLSSSSLNEQDGVVTFSATATLTDDALLRRQ